MNLWERISCTGFLELVTLEKEEYTGMYFATKVLTIGNVIYITELVGGN